MEQLSGYPFQKRISPDYYAHLMWIQQESVGSTARCKWLWYVLDCFATELSRIPDGTPVSWRSSALNPLLVRAFYGIPDDDAKEIESRVLTIMDADSLLVQIWERFYIDIYAVHSTNDRRWTLMRGQTLRPTRGDPTEQPPPAPMQGSGMWGPTFQSAAIFNHHSRCVLTGERRGIGRSRKPRGVAGALSPAQAALLSQTGELLPEERSSGKELIPRAFQQKQAIQLIRQALLLIIWRYPRTKLRMQTPRPPMMKLQVMNPLSICYRGR